MSERIADITLDRSLGEFTGPNARVRLNPQAMAVFCTLLNRRDRIVSREQLLTEAWPGRVISDATLNAAISQLRRALKEAGSTQLVIETRSKRGYRLLQKKPHTSGSPPAGAVPRRFLLTGGLLLASTILAALVLVARDPTPPEAMKLDLVLTEPDGSRHEPVILVEAGRTGSLYLGDLTLSLEFQVLDPESDRVRLNLHLARGANNIGVSHDIPYNAETLIELPSEEAGKPFAISLRASPVRDLARVTGRMQSQ